MELFCLKALQQYLILLALYSTVPGCSHDVQAKFTKPVDHKIKNGIFLVATEKLAKSSFRETVILLTHYSSRGATGLAINRPANVAINEAFPDILEFRKREDEVYLGGPVHTNAVFVLMQTQQPQKGMHHITNDVYFSAGLDALAHGLLNIKSDEQTRAYIGYSGWAPGQLDVEIHRGDWLIVHANIDIVFADNHEQIWKKLHKSWSGQWI